MTVHVVIPDTQVKPSAPTVHLSWIGEYILDKFRSEDDVKIIHLGDHWDMESLSSWDKKSQMEGRRLRADLDAGEAALKLITAPTDRYNRQQRDTNHHGRQWRPEWHLLRGNHEERFYRWLQDNPQWEDMFPNPFMSWEWQVHNFLDVVDLDGVWYSHYFYNPMTSKPFTGTIDNRLRQIGHSFTMGHQQTKLTGERYVGNQQQRGLIAGACYLHDEDYKGPQGNHHWRGIVVCHEVDNGGYDLMEVSLNYLCEKYEGKPLSEMNFNGR